MQGLDTRFEFCICILFFFFFFSSHVSVGLEQFRLLFMHCSWTVAATFDYSPMNSTPVHCSRVPQTSIFSQFFIKNGSHGTIHTFKNYFITVFTVFSFNKISSIQTDLSSSFYVHCCTFLLEMLWRKREMLGIYVWTKCYSYSLLLQL